MKTAEFLSFCLHYCNQFLTEMSIRFITVTINQVRGFYGSIFFIIANLRKFFTVCRNIFPCDFSHCGLVHPQYLCILQQMEEENRALKKG